MGIANELLNMLRYLSTKMIETSQTYLRHLAQNILEYKLIIFLNMPKTKRVG